MSFEFKQKFLILTSFFLLLALSGCLLKEKIVEKGGGEGVEKNLKLKMKNEKILMVVAPENFRDEEYQKPKEVLENAGYQVVTASKGVSVAKGMLGANISVDQDVISVNISDYSALVFVGGSGASVYFNDQVALNLAKEAISQGKVVGAICIAPSILANAGVLVGKSATCFSSEAGNLKAKGANYSGGSVTVDGEIVTADGPGSAEEFGRKILEVLGSN